MATTKNFNHRITNLSARIREHLHQFEPMDDETDYSPVSRPEVKRKNPYLRAGMAAGAVAGVGGGGLYINKKLGQNPQIAAAARSAGEKTGAVIGKGVVAAQDAYGRAKTALPGAIAGAKKQGRKAAFKGMQGAADVAESGMRAANKVGATKVGSVLGNVAKKVSKKSMGFFMNANLADTLVRLETKVSGLEFAVKPRSASRLMKTSKLNPLAIRKNADLGEFRVAPKGAAVNGPKGYFTDDIKDARGTAADLLRRKRKGQNVGFESILERHNFDRARDGGGRYATGNEISTADMAAAYVKPKAKADARKKALLVGAGVTGVAGAAAIGSKVAPRLTAGMGTGMARLVRRAVN